MPAIAAGATASNFGRKALGTCVCATDSALEAAAGAGLLERADLRANERWEPLRGRPRSEALLD